MDLYEKWDKWLSYVGNYIFRHNLFQYNSHYGSISYLSSCNTCYWTSSFFCPSAPYGNDWRCVDLSQISFLDLGLLYFQRFCFFFPPLLFPRHGHKLSFYFHLFQPARISIWYSFLVLRGKNSGTNSIFQYSEEILIVLEFGWGENWNQRLFLVPTVPFWYHRNQNTYLVLFWCQWWCRFPIWVLFLPIILQAVISRPLVWELHLILNFWTFLSSI